MSSPLPVNAKRNYRSREADRNGTTSGEEENAAGGNSDANVLSSSFDRAASIARLGSSPVPPNVRYSTSPPRSIHSVQSYGSTDLENVPTTSSGNLFRPLSTPTYNYDDNTLSVDLPEDQVAKVVKRHLVETSPAASVFGSSVQRVASNQSGRDGSVVSDGGASSASGVRSVHQLPGGAITHDIYKWAEDLDAEQARRTRSQSFYVPRNEPSDPALARLRNPGGFRRYFVYDKAARQGKEPPHWMTRTFVDFLALYGHFSGEDLSDSEDEEDEDILDERTTLLRRRRWRDNGHEDGDGSDRAARLIRRAQENAVQGTATPAKAVFLLLKSFVGTGKLSVSFSFSCLVRVTSFLTTLLIRRHVLTESVSRYSLKLVVLTVSGRLTEVHFHRFHNGGLFFSTGLLTAIAVISLYSFLLLVETRNKVPVSFGDIGGILYGRSMRLAVLTSITFSQVIKISVIYIMLTILRMYRRLDSSAHIWCLCRKTCKRSLKPCHSAKCMCHYPRLS